LFSLKGEKTKKGTLNVRYLLQCGLHETD